MDSAQSPSSFLSSVHFDTWNVSSECYKDGARSRFTLFTSLQISIQLECASSKLTSTPSASCTSPHSCWPAAQALGSCFSTPTDEALETCVQDLSCSIRALYIVLRRPSSIPVERWLRAARPQKHLPIHGFWPETSNPPTWTTVNGDCLITQR